jgi:hypothetical protein
MQKPFLLADPRKLSDGGRDQRVSALAWLSYPEVFVVNINTSNYASNSELIDNFCACKSIVRILIFVHELICLAIYVLLRAPNI